MKNAFLKLTDTVALNLIDAGQVRDNFVSMPSNQTQTNRGLFVKIAATHAGIVNRNNMFYLPDKMRAGAKTFVTPFQKPFLTNHDEGSDAIGRIVAAEYIDTSHLVKDKYRGRVIKDMAITDKLIDSFCDGSMPYAAQLDFVRTYMKDSILDDPEYQGMGFIAITAHITDKEAIEKFLDGRYLTVSVGASTDRASCSICKQDWSKDGMCDHRPGKLYDATKCFMVAGAFEYEEASAVNKPADRHAKVIELNFNGLRDNLRVEDIEFSGKLYEVRVAFPKEEEVMKLKDSEIVKDPKVEDNQPESFEDFMARVLDASKELTDADEEKAYQLVVDEIKAIGTTNLEIIMDQAKRKALPPTAFGVSNRAFPLVDTTHVLATKKLLDKYAGKKEEILSVIDRKAKALGVEDTVVTPPVETPVVETADQYAAKFIALVADAKEKHPELYKDFVKSVEKALCDEVVSLETKLGELRAEVKKVTDSSATLKTEYDVTTKEAEKLQDEVVKTKAALRDAKVKSLTLYKTLKSGTVVESVDTTITDATIDSELEILAKEVDIKKITDKLNDGTTRKPTGTVENPGGDQSNPVVDAKTVQSKLKQIEAEYIQLKFKNSARADVWLQDQMDALNAQGLLPKESK